MEQFKVCYDRKVTVWTRDTYLVEAKNAEDAVRVANSKMYDGDNDSFEYLSDSEQVLSIEEDPDKGVYTEEILVDEVQIWNNSQPELFFIDEEDVRESALTWFTLKMKALWTFYIGPVYRTHINKLPNTNGGLPIELGEWEFDGDTIPTTDKNGNPVNQQRFWAKINVGPATGIMDEDYTVFKDWANADGWSSPDVDKEVGNILLFEICY